MCHRGERVKVRRWVTITWSGIESERQIRTMHTDRNCPPWPSAISVNYFRTADPGKEHGTNKPPPTGKVQERAKGDTT